MKIQMTSKACAVGIAIAAAWIAAPCVAEARAKPNGIWNPMQATATAAASATIAETYARVFTPNNMMKNVTSGMQATNADKPRLPAIGSIVA